MLANLAVLNHKELNVLFGFATSLRDYFGAKVSAASQADVRKTLSEDLANHASFAHRLCEPVPPPPPTSL